MKAVRALIAGLALATLAGAAHPQGLCSQISTGQTGPEEQAEARFVAQLFRFSSGACQRCAQPEGAEAGACDVPGDETRACAAEAVEFVAREAIASLRSGASETRLTVLNACLADARQQLDAGPDGDVVPLDARIALSRRVADSLIAELDLALTAISEQELQLLVARELEDQLEKSQRRFLDDTASASEEHCPSLDDYMNGAALPVAPEEAVNCAQLIVAAARDRDFNALVSPLDRFRWAEPVACVREDGERKASCCFAADPDGTAANIGGTPNSPTFREDMGAFCVNAQAVGLKVPHPVSSDPEWIPPLEPGNRPSPTGDVLPNLLRRESLSSVAVTAFANVALEAYGQIDTTEAWLAAEEEAEASIQNALETLSAASDRLAEVLTRLDGLDPSAPCERLRFFQEDTMDFGVDIERLLTEAQVTLDRSDLRTDCFGE